MKGLSGSRVTQPTRSSENIFLFFTHQKKSNPRNRPEDLAAALSRGRLEIECTRVRKDGTRFEANVAITPLFDQEQHLYGSLRLL